jgi:hypothetical protein
MKAFERIDCKSYHFTTQLTSLINPNNARLQSSNMAQSRKRPEVGPSPEEVPRIVRNGIINDRYERAREMRLPRSERERQQMLRIRVESAEAAQEARARSQIARNERRADERRQRDALDRQRQDTREHRICVVM